MRKPLVAATVAVVSLGVAVTTVAPAGAAVDHRPGNQAAGWIDRQVEDGVITYDSGFGAFADVGTTIDAVLALQSLGGHRAQVRRLSAGVARHVGGYVSGAAFGDAGSVYAGPAAKAAVLAQAAGARATSFGGTNLIALLRGRVSTSGATAGRISDKSSFGDNANVLGQAFAARALTAARAPEAARVTTFLLAQQCSAGYFRTFFNSSKTSAAQSCDAGRGAGLSAPDADATSTAALSLWPQHRTPRVKSALARAKRWLLAHQHRDGSFGGGASTGGANANSTGLAGQALAVLGAPKAARRAAIWVRSVQAHEVRGCADRLSRQNGAIAYDKATLRRGLAGGITTADRTSWIKASAQGLAVLALAPRAAGRLRLAATAHRSGGTVRVVVRGAAPGDAVCVSGAGKHVRAVAGASGVARVLVKAAGTHVRFAVRDSAGRHRAAVVRVVR